MPQYLLQAAVSTSSIVKMKNFSEFNARNVALGVGFAVAIFFVIVTVVLMTDLVLEIYSLGKKESVEARATLIGNMIGALFSGGLAIVAALGAVHLEREAKRAEEKARHDTIAEPAIAWISSKALVIRRIVVRMDRWVRDSVTALAAPKFDREVALIYDKRLDTKIREAVERDFLAIVPILKEVDDASAEVAEKAISGSKDAEVAFLSTGDKRPSATALMDFVQRLLWLVNALNRAHRQLTDGRASKEIDATYQRLDDLMVLINDAADDYEARRVLDADGTSGEN